MKKLDKILKNHRHIVFLDFEGTQYSHEMIALGAVAVSLNKSGIIKKRKEPFKCYVKAKNKIGKYVTTLTGISEKTVSEKGIGFSEAMVKLRKYCGRNFKKSSFLTYGNHDMRILGQSIAYNIDFPKEICSQIQQNYVDYADFMNEFLKDEKGNCLSLVHSCELFNVPLAEPSHDPEVDAINLANLYDAFLKNPGFVLARYKKALPHLSHFPQPILKAVKKLCNNEDVTADDFDGYIQEYLS